MMVKVSWSENHSGITSTGDFKSGLSACVNIGTTTELNMRDFFHCKWHYIRASCF